MFRSDFRKKGVSSKSNAASEYVFVKRMHFQISLLLRELQVIRDFLWVRDIAEKSLTATGGVL